MSIDPHAIRSCVYLMEESVFPFSAFSYRGKSFTNANSKSAYTILCNKFTDFLRRGKILYPEIGGLAMFTVPGSVITHTRRYVSNGVSIWGAVFRCINIHANGSFSTVRADGYVEYRDRHFYLSNHLVYIV